MTSPRSPASPVRQAQRDHVTVDLLHDSLPAAGDAQALHRRTGPGGLLAPPGRPQHECVLVRLDEAVHVALCEGVRADGDVPPDQPLHVCLMHRYDVRPFPGVQRAADQQLDVLDVVLDKRKPRPGCDRWQIGIDPAPWAAAPRHRSPSPRTDAGASPRIRPAHGTWLGEACTHKA
jgi:hypothetical protein